MVLGAQYHTGTRTGDPLEKKSIDVAASRQGRCALLGPLAGQGGGAEARDSLVQAMTGMHWPRFYRNTYELWSILFM